MGPSCRPGLLAGPAAGLADPASAWGRVPLSDGWPSSSITSCLSWVFSFSLCHLRGWNPTRALPLPSPSWLPEGGAACVPTDVWHRPHPPGIAPLTLYPEGSPSLPLGTVDVPASARRRPLRHRNCTRSSWEDEDQCPWASVTLCHPSHQTRDRSTRVTPARRRATPRHQNVQRGFLWGQACGWFSFSFYTLALTILG